MTVVRVTLSRMSLSRAGVIMTPSRTRHRQAPADSLTLPSRVSRMGAS